MAQFIVEDMLHWVLNDSREIMSLKSESLLQEAPQQMRFGS
jgi:hypothetical protein